MGATSHITIKNYLNGVMDTDSDWNDVSSSDFIEALNLRVGFEGQDNVVSNVEGNRAVQSSYAIGSHAPIGFVKNKRQNYGFFFITDGNNSHRIILYSPQTGFKTTDGLTLGGGEPIIEVARSSAFNFNTFRKIHSAKVVNNKYLQWADAEPTAYGITGNPPSKLNIEKAILKGKFLKFELTLPLDSQSNTYTTIGAGTTVNIEKRNLDGVLISTNTLTIPTASYTRSSLRTVLISALTSAGYQLDVTDKRKIIVNSPTIEQRLSLVFPTSLVWAILTPINHYPILEKHHFALAKPQPKYAPVAQYISDATAARQNQTPQYCVRYYFDDGEVSAWGSFGIIPHYSNVVKNRILIDFYDEKLNDPSWLCLIRKVEIGFRLRNESPVRSLRILDACDIGIATGVKDLTTASYESNHYVQKELNYGSVVASDDNTTSDTTQVLKHFDRVPLLSCTHEIVSDENGIIRGFWGNNRHGLDNLSFIDADTTLTPHEIYVDIGGGLFDYDYAPVVLKRHGIYKWGIVYYDSIGRKSAVQYCGQFETLGGANQTIVDFNIRHTPPSWAESYQIVMTKEQRRAKYRQVYVTRTGNRLTVSPELTISTNTVNSDIYFDSANSNALDLVQKGDKIMGIEGTGSGEIADIIGYTIKTTGANSYLELIVSGGSMDDICDIYTPREQDTQSYYETGLTFPITGGYHIADQQNQTSSLPAIIRFRGGDAIWDKSINVPNRNFGYFAAEQQDYIGHNSIMENIGRLNFVDANAKQIDYRSEICFTDTYNVNGSYNGLSSFRSTDNIQVNIEFGALEKLIYKGSLWALCQLKAQPIYVGRDRLLSADGSEALTRTNRILNIAKDTAHDWGTFNPESVVEDDNFFYYFDLYNGKIIRTGADGQVNTSAIKNNNLFKNISEKNLRFAITNRFSTKVIGGIEPRYGMVYMSFQVIMNPDGTAAAAKTYGFVSYENKFGFTGEYSFLPYMFGDVANEFLSFSDTIWVHDDKVNTCKFFNIQYDCYVTPVINEPKEAVKQPMNISVHSDKLWVVDRIYTKPSHHFPTGQLSTLNANKFKNYEGKWCADFLRDMNDDGAQFAAIVDSTTRQTTALLRGRYLKDTAFAVRLKLNDPSVKSKLRTIETEVILSESTKT